MRLYDVTLAALDRTTMEVKRISELVPKLNDWQTCLESVVLSEGLVCPGCFVA